ncbi:lytic transglycosylase domain-containing protein [Vulcaniibacterium tengchongense]|uniref:Soluble lytic murein transglycosylase-like protein n=1 Tax=Vulcaniibacterium tengchongense TaxID=1273429 RepID=A0A3N4VHW5_9GAMM|nr:lytic transglycosylase domain-containing protein [Vulcaniibacterium tengchongense]RPE81085.1 soluble lytic murein transglycosylase-like protein [Vulcaniibacterium tengchongense]
MRGAASALGIVCLLAAAPAAAGTLYRCEGADGVRSYVSKRVAGAACTVISQDRGGRRASAPKPEPAAPEARAMGAVSPATATATVAASVAPAPALATGAVPTSAPPPAPARAGALPTRRVQGQIYSYIKDGVRHYTSQPPRGLANATAVRTIRYSFIETCYACAARPGVDFGRVRLNTDAYRDEIAAAARRFGVDEAIVRAIIHAESAYNPNALSRAGAQGLMQLMPATARRFGVGNPFDAAQNIQGGVQYLAWLLKRYNNDLTLAAAGYNAGEGAVDKYGGVPPYAETQRYVQRVAVLAERYRSAVAVLR